MAVQITVIGSPDRKLEELIRASGLRPTVASAVDLLALTHPAAPQPDILFVDIRPHGQVPAALGPIKRQHPALSIVLAATQLTPELMLEAMRAGVTECVAEPLRLIGRVANVSPGGEVKVRFLPPGEAASDLLEKLAFRRHRRAVAGSRQAPSRPRGR